MIQMVSDLHVDITDCRDGTLCTIHLLVLQKELIHCINFIILFLLACMFINEMYFIFENKYTFSYVDIIHA